MMADPFEAIGIVRQIAPETPLMWIPELDLWIKDERAMPTRSFKVRGAAVWLARTRPERAVVTASSGNHARALQWALAASGDKRRLTAVLTATADEAKIKALADSGCEVILVDGDNEARDARARDLARSWKASFSSSHDDDNVIAGQGTVGAEIIRVLAEVPSIFVPVCGGGLFAGILVAITRSGGCTRVIGVQPAGANSMARSLADGHRIRLEQVNTCCDALRASAPGSRCFEIAQLCSGEMMSVSDDEIRDAQRQLQKYIGPVEVSAAAGVAGALHRGARNAVCVVTGSPDLAVTRC